MKHRWAAFLLAALLVMLSAIAGCVPSAPINTLWFTTSNSGREVSVWKMGEPFTFGQQNLSVYVDGEEVYQTYIANDGAVLFYTNYSATWESSSLLVLVFKGDEQKDEILYVHLDGDTISVESNRIY